MAEKKYREGINPKWINLSVHSQNRAGLSSLWSSPFSSTLLLQQLLRRIPDPTMCLEVTEQSLDQHPSLAASHFLANYLTTHFYGELSAVRHREIQALYIGSKVRKKMGWWEAIPGGETAGLVPTSELMLSMALLPGTCHSWSVLYKTFTLTAHHILVESLRSSHSHLALSPKWILGGPPDFSWFPWCLLYQCFPMLTIW